jgi:hypothetical protein
MSGQASGSVVEADTEAAIYEVACTHSSQAVGILGVNVRNATIFCSPEWTLKC